MGLLIIIVSIVVMGYGDSIVRIFVREPKPKSWADQYEERMIREGKWSPK